MKFYKYRAMFAGGYAPWEFRAVADHVRPKDIEAEEDSKYNNWSEHFRRVEVVRLKKPSQKWLEEEILDLKSQRKYLAEQIKVLSGHLVIEELS